MPPYDISLLNSFDPSEARARAVCERMQKRLADSLEYIAGEIQTQSGVHPPNLKPLFQRLREGPVSPLLFGAYCDLVLALEENAMAEARRLLTEISEAANTQAGPLITDLADPNADPAANRYCRLVDTDLTMAVAIRPPAAEEAAGVRVLIAEAFRLLDAGNPDLAKEVRTLVREIVLAAGPDDPKAPQFDGVSSFMLWGMVALNIRSYKTALDLVQALAHESGHNLLFGLCAYGPLQENDERDRYSSPLRADPRPMDGIVHATYVTARMHQAVQRLIEAGVLNGEQLAEAKNANASNAKWFAAGMETVDKHALLTPLGQEVMESARRYMAPFLPQEVMAS